MTALTTPFLCLTTAIRPACAVLGERFVDRRAELVLLAIALQESGLRTRVQRVKKMPAPDAKWQPARGLWQFELIGVEGVLRHAASGRHADALCAKRGVVAAKYPVQAALERDDVLAAGFARLLLFTLPQALPAIGDVDRAWDQYVSAWRPGKPHRDRWTANYARAREAL